MGISVGPKTLEEEHQKNQKAHHDFSTVFEKKDSNFIHLSKVQKKDSNFIHLSKVLGALLHFLGPVSPIQHCTQGNAQGQTHRDRADRISRFLPKPKTKQDPQS